MYPRRSRFGIPEHVGLVGSKFCNFMPVVVVIAQLLCELRANGAFSRSIGDQWAAGHTAVVDSRQGECKRGVQGGGGWMNNTVAGTYAPSATDQREFVYATITTWTMEGSSLPEPGQGQVRSMAGSSQRPPFGLLALWPTTTIYSY